MLETTQTREWKLGRASILAFRNAFTRCQKFSRDFRLLRETSHANIRIGLFPYLSGSWLPHGIKRFRVIRAEEHNLTLDLLLTVLHWMLVFHIHANFPYLEKDGIRILFTELVKLGRNNFAWATPSCRIIHHHKSISRRRDGLVKGIFRTDIDDAHLQGTARSWSRKTCKGWRKGTCR